MPNINRVVELPPVRLMVVSCNILYDMIKAQDVNNIDPETWSSQLHGLQCHDDEKEKDFT